MPDFWEEFFVLWALAPDWLRFATKLFLFVFVVYLIKPRHKGYEAKNWTRIQSLADAAMNKPLFLCSIVLMAIFAFCCIGHALYLDLTMYIADAPFARLPK